jgi:hypothetical protein
MMNNTTRNSTTRSNWSVKFGAVKSVDASEVIFKATVKVNPYLRSKTYLKRPGISMKGKTNAEAY